ncbi:branched-chain amino acid ABC transporter substrate-binding protein [Paraburkholderia sp.]|uniref:branched-chain amino acid ABC transporter substrate-binding protein n=1 Tax=Paraburkholderia sp. TaxID=1926495 RepID=UPI0039E62ABD
MKQPARKASLIAYLVFAALSVAGAASHAQTGAASASATAAKVVRIGVAGPLTGGLAHFGKDNENGARLAVEEINQTGLVINGQRITLAIDSQDDAADPKTGTQVAQKLVDDGVVAVVGHYNSGVSIPASRIYSDAGIAQISPSSTIPDYTLQGFKTTFRLVATDAAQSPALAAYAVRHLGVKRVAVVDDATQAGLGQASEFEKAVRADGGTIVAREATTASAIDFRAILTKIKATRPDTIYFGGTDAGAGPFAKQAAGLGLTARILGSDGICTEKMAELAGDAVNRVTCSEAGMPLSKMSRGDAFNSRYKARYGEPLVLYAPFTYDAVFVIVEAMKRSNSTDHAKILDAIHQTDYTGVTGHIVFDAKGDIKEPAISIFDFERNRKTLLDVVRL